MSAAQYEEGLRIEAERQSREAADRAKAASDAAQAQALAQRKKASEEYLTSAKETIAGRNNPELLNKIYSARTGEATKAADIAFGGSRKRMLEEQAATGGIGQPNSRYAIGQAEAGHQRDLGDIIGKIQAEQLGAEYDMNNQAISDILAAQLNAENIGAGYQQGSMSEFQNLRALNEADRQSRIEEALAPYLARVQADANSPGTLDYLNTAFSGLGALGKAYGGWKAGQNQKKSG